MATDFLLVTPSTATVAGLLVAGLGAIYVYAQLGTSKDADADTDADVHATSLSADGDAHASNEGKGTSGGARKGKKKQKKGRGVAEAEAEAEGKGKRDGESKDQRRGEVEVEGGPAVAVPFPRIVPGDFEGASAGVDVGTNVGPQEASSAMTTSKRGSGGKTKTKTKKTKKQGKGKDRDEDRGEGSETGKEVGLGVGRIAAYGPRSGDSTDASVSLSPTVPASTLVSSRAMGKGNLRASTRFVPPSQPRETRPSLSFDTDSSWTHVDHRRAKTSKSTDGQGRGLAHTSSDPASTASDSPVAERMDDVAIDMRGARADLVPRTLAEKFVPRPKETGVDDMLEQPDFPTLARVMRVQPPADETPVPGFSWEDYGDVVEESVLVDDADQEDEGEWGVVKSRHRNQTKLGSSQMTMTTVAAAEATTSTSHAPAAPRTTSKKQRQNARKRELAKSAKADAELARLEGLAQHKRELEQLRIIEQSRQGGGKRPGGGMKATVDSQGKLVWE